MIKLIDIEKVATSGEVLDLGLLAKETHQMLNRIAAHLNKQEADVDEAIQLITDNTPVVKVENILKLFKELRDVAGFQCPSGDLFDVINKLETEVKSNLEYLCCTGGINPDYAGHIKCFSDCNRQPNCMSVEWLLAVLRARDNEREAQDKEITKLKAQISSFKEALNVIAGRD